MPVTKISYRLDRGLTGYILEGVICNRLEISHNQLPVIQEML
jgi:hypothetical protein